MAHSTVVRENNNFSANTRINIIEKIGSYNTKDFQVIDNDKKETVGRYDCINLLFPIFSYFF